MSLDYATELIRQTLVLACSVSAPMLVIGIVVGIFVSLLQANHPDPEQSLAFVPKIAAMVTSVVVFMPWIGHRVMEYAATMFSLAQ